MLGEGFDRLVDNGEMGDVVSLTALSKASNRFRIPGMYELALDADISILEPETAACLLYNRPMLVRIRQRLY